MFISPCIYMYARSVTAMKGTEFCVSSHFTTPLFICLYMYLNRVSCYFTTPLFICLYIYMFTDRSVTAMEEIEVEIRVSSQFTTPSAFSVELYLGDKKVCYSVLYCVALCCSVMHCGALCCSVLQLYCSVLQRVVLSAELHFGTGWRRLVGCLKVQIIFRKRATNYRALLRKMTYEDKSSYDSTPPCIKGCDAECYSLLQCVSVCCSVLQCVAVFCSVLHCVAFFPWSFTWG